MTPTDPDKPINHTPAIHTSDNDLRFIANTAAVCFTVWFTVVGGGSGGDTAGVVVLTAEILCPGVAIGAVVVYVERAAIAVLSLILRSSLCDGCCYC